MRRRRERWARLRRRLGQWRAIAIAEGRLWLAIAAGLTVLCVVGLLLFAPFFDVRTIRVRRQDPRIDPEEVQRVLAPLFSQRLVLVSRGQVSLMLQGAYPDLQEVSIEKDYPSTLTVSLSLDPVVAIADVATSDVDGEAPAELTGTGSDATSFTYLTARGTFVAAPIRITTVPLQTIVLADWAVRPQNGTTVIDPEVLQTIMLARDILLRDFGLTSQRIVYYLRSREFHISTERATLWFDLTSELSVQFERFRTFLKTVSFDQVKEYIDLRIADRVVYR